MFPKSYNYPISWDVGGEVFGYEFKWKKKSNQRVSKTFNPLIYNCLFFREAYTSHREDNLFAIPQFVH
jgi:hypothetical protein